MSYESDAQPFRFSDDLRPSNVPTPVQEKNTARSVRSRFIERHSLNSDVFEYARAGREPGKILIFNQETFDNPKILPRRGSTRDVNEIIVTFQRLGFNVSEDDVMTNLTVAEIKSKLKAVVEDKTSLRETNCLVMFFLSHGKERDQLEAKDGTLSCEDLWTPFNKCPELDGKPKLFVFQACKGKFYTNTNGEIDERINDNPDSGKLLDITSFVVNRLGSDMLLLYSTLEGLKSFRNIHAGTWFIQELCKNFTAYGRRDDVISLITRTAKCVSGAYFNFNDNESEEKQKQMPIFVSTLSKKFYLNRNKDRHLLLEIMKSQNDIFQLLSEIVS